MTIPDGIERSMLFTSLSSKRNPLGNIWKAYYVHRLWMNFLGSSLELVFLRFNVDAFSATSGFDGNKVQSKQ